jgi:hypothetical protein
MKPANTPRATGRAALDRRILAAEQRLQLDRDQLRRRSEAVGIRLRRALGSPATLLLAAGVGFAVHRLGLLQRANPAQPSRPSQAPKSPLQGLLHALTVGMSLFALLPSTATRPAGRSAR